MPHLSIARILGADPVSTALLLTGTDSLRWWPGLVVTDVAAGVVHATVTHGGRSSAVTLRVMPPRRTGTAFLTRFAVSGGEFGQTQGGLELRYCPAGTRAVLEVDGPAEALTVPGRRFLAHLAHAAEKRSSAA